jgi:dTDP-L-rhamnose 4-epimerase
MLEIIVRDRLPVRKIVFASTQAIYGEGAYECDRDGVFHPGPRPLAQLARGEWEIRCPACGGEARWKFTDENAVSAHTAYAISKYAAELTFLNLGRKYGIPSVGLRFSITHGPRNSFYNAYSGICRIFCQRILHGDRPVVFEDGRQLRDYINVEDVARANLLVMGEAGADYGIFNAGGGRAVSVLEFLDALAKAFDTAIEPELTGEFRFGDTRHTVSDISKLRAFGWAPRVPLEESLRRYVFWLREQPDPGRGYRAADREMRGRGVIQRGGGR